MSPFLPAANAALAKERSRSAGVAARSALSNASCPSSLCDSSGTSPRVSILSVPVRNLSGASGASAPICARKSVEASDAYWSKSGRRRARERGGVVGANERAPPLTRLMLAVASDDERHKWREGVRRKNRNVGRIRRRVGSRALKHGGETLVGSRLIFLAQHG